MRIIRFRGKCTDDGMWRYGDLLHDNGLVWINDDGLHCTVDEKTVGQFTGAKDKNGNDIFEGDIVHWKSPYRHSFTKAVGHDDAYGRFTPMDIFMGYDCEVLGNIYDNPEMLDYKPESEWPKNGLLEGEFRIRALYENGCMAREGHIYVAQYVGKGRKKKIRVWGESSKIDESELRRYGTCCDMGLSILGDGRVQPIYEIINENQK